MPGKGGFEEGVLGGGPGSRADTGDIIAGAAAGGKGGALPGSVMEDKPATAAVMGEILGVGVGAEGGGKKEKEFSARWALKASCVASSLPS